MCHVNFTQALFCKLLSFSGWLLLFPAEGSFAGEGVLKDQAIGAWVEPFQTEYKAALPVSGTTTDIQFLLYDRQIHAEEKTRFNHFSYRFLTESGVQENSQISLSFDPKYETLTLHRLKIVRGDVVIDKLAGQKIEVLRRETGAERQVYDGRLSAMIVLEDTRVGDIVEYAYSISGANPVFDDHFSTFESTRWSTPVHQHRLRVIWHKNRLVTVKNQGSPKAPEVTARGEMQVAKLDEDQLPPLISDGDLPGQYFSHPWVEFSDYPNWAAVAVWASAQFPVDQELPSAAQKEVERLKVLPDEEDRILGALRWVQDNIRYVGFFQGIHSHKPFPLETVLSRRFGDCKDKSNLLTTMLRQMGVRCRVGLVATQSRKAIQDWLPMPEAFDHAIVGVDTPRGVQWIDGTASYQRGPLRHLYLPDYAWVLALEPNTRGLVTVNPTGHEQTKLEVRESFLFADYQGSVRLKVETTHQGARADSQRAYFAANSKNEIERNYMNFYAEAYPKIRQSKALEMHDDETKNELKTIENYELEDAWKESADDATKLEFKVAARMVSSEFFEPSTRIRTMPFLLPNPRNSTQTYPLEVPTSRGLNNDSTEIINPHFEFSIDEKSTEKTTDVIYRYRSKRNYVSAEDAAGYLADVKKAKNQVGYTLTIPVAYAKSTIEEINSEKKETPSHAQESRPAWILIMVSVMAFLTSSMICILLFFWDPSRRTPRFSSAIEVQGISGWLAFFGISIMLRPFIQLWSNVSGLYDITSESWSALTREDSPAFHSLWEPFLILDSAFSAALVPIGFLLILLYLQHRTSFPYLQAAVLILMVALSFTEGVCINILETAGKITDKTVGLETTKDFTRCLFSGIIWVPYLFISRRVQNTFIRRRKAPTMNQNSMPPPLPPSFRP